MMKSFKKISSICQIILMSCVSLTASAELPKIDLFRLDWATFEASQRDIKPQAPVIKKRSEYPKRWIVAELNGKKITNKDVEKYIQHSSLTDANMIQMFREADGDWDRYKVLLDDWTYSQWRQSLKKFLYLKVLEKEALRAGKNRVAFTTSRDKYFRMCEDSEHETLEKLLDEGKGIEHARMKFSDFLIKQHYPQSNSTSNQDLYFEWLAMNDGRIRESIRRAEAERMEYLLNHPKAKRDYFQPISQIHTIFHRGQSQAREFFSQNNLTAEKINLFLQQNAQAKLAISKVIAYSLDQAPLYEIKNWNTLRFNHHHQIMVEQSKKLEQPARLQTMIRYLAAIDRFAKNYSNTELEERSKAALDQFVISPQGNFQHLILAKLYNVAQELKSHSIQLNSPQQIAVLENSLSEAMKKLVQEIANKDFFLRENTRELPNVDQIFLRLVTLLKQQNMNSSLPKALSEQVIDLFAWMAKVELKIQFLSAPVDYQAQLREYGDNTTQRLVEEYYLETEYQRQLSSYHQKLKRQYRLSVRINPEGEGMWSDSNSIGLIFP